MEPLFFLFRKIGIRLFLGILFLGTFDEGSSQTITKLTDLSFPTLTSEAPRQIITIAPEDTGAASFNATGTPGQKIRVKVLEKRIRMFNSRKRIRVFHFTYGGSLTTTGRAGEAIFDRNGTLKNMRIGASARIRKNPRQGTYSGTFTVRFVYK